MRKTNPLHFFKFGLQRTAVHTSIQLGQSFEAGTVQIAYFLEPMATIVRDKVKAHVIGTGTEVISGTTALVIWANVKWLESSAEAPVRLLKALLRGANYYCDARESHFAKNADVGEILASHAKISPALVGRLCDTASDRAPVAALQTQHWVLMRSARGDRTAAQLQFEAPRRIF